MKKTLSIFSVLIMIISLLVGCGMGQKDTDTLNFIGAEKAREIALKKAGITAEEVIFDRVELDRDDGIWCYEIEFKKGYTEYDAKIKAIDGTVLKWEVDAD